MKKLLPIIALACLFALTACNKSGCDDCTTYKQEFCTAMKDYGCNSAMLTQYIDNMVKSCGQTEANTFISQTTQQCTDGTLVCTECQ